MSYTKYAQDPRWITARFASTCSGRDCSQRIEAGEEAFYYPSGKQLYAVACGHAEENSADFNELAFDEDFCRG